ncbi:MAG: TraB/GumN family protein [Flavobacteriales bacterium]|nr:TraB/GumN family protein [Flavobacteriales bacterium]
MLKSKLMKTNNSVVGATFAVALLLVASHSTFGQGAENQNALLWRISGNGLPKASYVYGTMHVSKKLAFHLGDPFFDALEQSDAVALELDPAQWLKDMGTSKLFTMGVLESLGRGPGVRGFYDNAFNTDFPKREALLGVLAEEPYMIDDLLYRITDHSGNSEELTYLDLFIFQAGRKLGKPVHGLERFDSSLELVMLANTEEGTKADRERHRKRMAKYNDGPPLHELLETAYRNGDLARLDSLFDAENVSSSSRKYMLDMRNDTMLNGMLPLMRNGSLFTAVGAAHLPGEGGILAKLRAMGYTVEAVPSAFTTASIQRRHKYEEMYKPPVLTKVSGPDGDFSMDVPSQYYELPWGGNGRTLISTDPTNGSYVVVQRLQTLAPLRGLSTDDVCATLDSILYEGIPGRLGAVKKSVDAGGRPQYELTSVTMRGNRLRYRIIVAPSEIFIVKVGTRNSAKAKKDGDRIHASLAFDGGLTRTGTFVPKTGGCSVALPGRLFVRMEGPKAPAARESMATSDLMVQGVQGNHHFMLMGSSLYDPTFLEEDTFELARLADAFEEHFTLERVSTRHFELAGRPALDGIFTNRSDTVFARWTLRGPHFYQLSAVAPRMEAMDFLGSFKLLPQPVPTATELFTDSAAGFTVRTSSVNQEIDPIRKLMQRARPRYRGWDEDEEDDGQMRTNETMTFVSDTSTDVTSVFSQKMHRFESWKDEDAFWNDYLENVASGAGAVVKHSKRSINGGTERLDAVITDTATIRCVHVTMMQRGARVILVRTVADTLEALAPWSATFHGTIAPLDTILEGDLFELKGDAFMADLTGTDSLRAAQARASFNTVGLKPKHGAPLVAWLRTATFDKDHRKQRYEAIEALGNSGSVDAMPYLREVYSAAGDSTELQLAALEAMLLSNTAAGVKAFGECIAVEPTLVDNEWRIGGVFFPLFDTLELAKPLFPAILKLARYDEYRSVVYNLLAALVDEKLLPKTVIVPEKDAILAEAQSSLKRLLAEASTESAGGRYNDDRSYTYAGPEDLNDLGTVSYWQELYGTGEYRDEKKTASYTLRGRSYQWLAHYRHLLIHHYDDPAVKAWFDKMLKGNDKDEVMKTALYLKYSGKSVDPAIWQRFSTDEASALWLRGELMEQGWGDLFTGNVTDQVAMARLQLNSGHWAEPKDSMEYVGKRMGENRFGSGAVHFFKVKRDGEEEWSLAATGFQPTDSTQVEWEPIFTHWVSRFDEDQLEKEMDDAMKVVRYAGRRRVKIEEDYSWLGNRDW